MFLGILINLWHCCDVIMEGQVALVAAFSSSVLLGMGALWCSGQASWPIKHSNTMVVIPLTSRFGTVAGAESCCKKKISIAILYGDADFLFPAGVVTGWLTVACLCLTGQEQDVANSCWWRSARQGVVLWPWQQTQPRSGGSIEQMTEGCGGGSAGGLCALSCRGHQGTVHSGKVFNHFSSFFRGFTQVFAPENCEPAL